MVYSIGEISKLTGISRDRLRNYEKIGILKPTRETENQYRKYSEHDIDKVLAIELYRAAEVNLTDIKKICMDCSIEKLQNILNEKKAALEEQLFHLQLVTQKVDELLYACTTVGQNLDKISISTMEPFDIVGEIEDYRSYGDYHKLFEYKNFDEPILYKMQRKLLFNQNGIYENKMIITRHSAEIEQKKRLKCVYTVIRDGEDNEDPMKATFHKCMEYCKNNRLTPTGEVYIGMLLLFCKDGSIESFLELRGPIK